MTAIKAFARRVIVDSGVKSRIENERIARAGSVKLKGVDLPPSSIRLGGHNFEDDGAFLDAAVRDAQRLQGDLGISVSSRVLDIGCGVGRLPIGLLAHFGQMPPYTGVDVTEGVIRWCQKHITDPAATFVHLDLANKRYNPRGEAISGSLRLPLSDASFDAIYLYSVFSHMELLDIKTYLKEFKRLLAPDATVFLTAFVEDDVPDVEVNPAGYGTFPGDWEGELHCVRYNRGFLEQQITSAGLKVSRLDHAGDTDGQSAIYLQHA
jgi:SAM-dependent methyltransferase